MARVIPLGMKTNCSKLPNTSFVDAGCFFLVSSVQQKYLEDVRSVYVLKMAAERHAHVWKWDVSTTGASKGSKVGRDDRQT